MEAERHWRDAAAEGRWDEMTSSDWDAFAGEWLAELQASSLTPDSEMDLSDTAEGVGEAVVLMNFLAGPDQQWRFICSAVAQAGSDDELRHIAAGPVEHLLGWHGENLIARAEAKAAEDGKFARTLTGLRKYKMADEVWARVQAIQATVSDPLLPLG